MMNPKAEYVIRFFFEWTGTCFWCGNDAARERFDYYIEPEDLPLSESTVKRAKELMEWHDKALNWEYPPDPGPWRQEECDRFNQAAKELLSTVRQELGERFEGRAAAFPSPSGRG
ncbi:hypothetical protein KSD_78390 [Ktedonobacter sp. SOSP1-85]|uniref:hypothetical protein n=1 Tax=Ktedonobacter sp. SOSP1-85 TaxID=2778367 RepID=UPI00191653F7|nr:hypothetical protein [Ktedonobacter sp. SOSP1-85]GHO80068.1 hypothetical protein KSD_78390 [Ktedonobacter sp. SOSP1-85]